ncbi:uncharacterized protein METZ01_LOCUS348227 [marine metagenome]|uniref:Uncharacterized protein n=1 Tax=marine metagenome TaxID=408172 RepID=A0A382RCE7_9ZZZZ
MTNQWAMPMAFPDLRGSKHGHISV